MDKILRYHIKIPPDRVFEIARDRLIDHPGSSIEGDIERGVFKARGMRVLYAMQPRNGGTDLTLEFTRKPPVPWKIIKAFIDREAKKW